MGSRKSTYELGNIDEISKKSVEGASFFLLLVQGREMQESRMVNQKRDRKKKRETEMDGFENSPPPQRIKNGKIKKWLLCTVRKMI